MKLRVAARAALVVAVLFGCAVPLTKERGEPVTRLVISNGSPLPLRAAVFRDDVDCSGAHPASFDGAVAVLDTPAKPWETVAFSYADTRDGTRSTCTGIGSFPADAQHEYHVDVGESSGACGMRVTRRAAGTQDALIPVEIEPREPAPTSRAGASSRPANRAAAPTPTPSISPPEPVASCRADARFRRVTTAPSS